MREILFRGKLLAGTSAGEWVYGNLVVKPDMMKSGQVALIVPDDTPIGKYGQVDPSTVGQFTGLYDCKKNRIFEGDILAGYEPDEGSTESVGFPISYLDAGFGVKYQTTPPLYHVLERRDCEYYAVIGNVHDNPELAINAVS